MFRSQDHPQGAKLFHAKVILKTFTKQFLLFFCVATHRYIDVHFPDVGNTTVR